MASDLSTLIASLREAREGSREFDRDVRNYLFPDEALRLAYVGGFGPDSHEIQPNPAPHYTTDLTAAVGLCERVLPGWSSQLNTSENRSWHTVVLGRSYPTNARVAVEAKTLPLALCLAVLIAKDQAP